jgi:hypothetical protein
MQCGCCVFNCSKAPTHRTAAVSDASARISPCKSIQIGCYSEGAGMKKKEKSSESGTKVNEKNKIINGHKKKKY